MYFLHQNLDLVQRVLMTLATIATASWEKLHACKSSMLFYTLLVCLPVYVFQSLAVQPSMQLANVFRKQINVITMHFFAV